MCTSLENFGNKTHWHGYVAGKANVLANFVSRVPLQRLEGLLDEAAFDLSCKIPPTSAVFATLEEWREDFN